MKNFKLIVLFTIILLELFQMYIVIYSMSAYIFLHGSASFLVISIYLIWSWYRILFGDKQLKYFLMRVVLIAAITIGTPILLVSTRPDVTYEEGKENILEEYHEYMDYEFIEYGRGMNSIPVTKDSKRFLVKFRNYYYRLSDGVSNRYFTVNPINGEILILNEGYWAEDIN